MRVEEKNFHTYKTRSFLFLLFGPLLFSKLITCFFVFFKNDLKCYRSTTFTCTNHLWTLIAIELLHTRNFWCSRTNFAVFCGLSFWVLDPSIFRGQCNFLISNPNASRGGGVKVLFGSGLPWMLKCLLTGRSILLTNGS